MTATLRDCTSCFHGVWYDEDGNPCPKCGGAGRFIDCRACDNERFTDRDELHDTGPSGEAYTAAVMRECTVCTQCPECSEPMGDRPHQHGDDVVCGDCWDAICAEAA